MQYVHAHEREYEKQEVDFRILTFFIEYLITSDDKKQAVQK